MTTEGYSSEELKTLTLATSLCKTEFFSQTCMVVIIFDFWLFSKGEIPTIVQGSPSLAWGSGSRIFPVSSLSDAGSRSAWKAGIYLD